MKKLALFLAGALLCGGAAGCSKGEEKPETPVWAKDKVLKILTIGNSFSDDTMEYVWKIARSLGVENIKLGNLFIGGCSLDTHYENAMSGRPVYEYRTNAEDEWKNEKGWAMGDAIVSEDWDFVSLQQSSGVSGVPASYSRLEELAAYVKSLAGAETKLVWNMTWAYQGDSTHAEFKNYDKDQTAMYRKIVETVKSEILSKDVFSAVIPVGTAIQNVRTSFVGDTLTRDGFHLNYSLGRYVAGLTLVHALTGLDLTDDVFCLEVLNEKRKKVALEGAKNAVKTPYEVTPSLYTTSA